MRYMLDTNICVYIMKAHPPAALARLSELNQGDAVMSVVTYAESRAGLELLGAIRAQNERALHLLTQHIPVLPFNEAAAEHYGLMRAAVRDGSDKKRIGNLCTELFALPRPANA